MMKQLSALILTAVLGVGVVGASLAASATRVEFAEGNDNAALDGKVTGNEYADYVLGARAGQTMSVSLITNGTAYFNILPPGSDGEAIYVGSTDGDNATIKLPQGGDYTVRVYLMGDDKDSGRIVAYTLSFAIK